MMLTALTTRRTTLLHFEASSLISRIRDTNGITAIYKARYSNAVYSSLYPENSDISLSEHIDQIPIKNEKQPI